MEEKKKQEQLPLDAKLLSEALIELNTSRRSVGLYPPEHPITRQSIERAFTSLKKLFELRSSITLGVAKDVLMIDEYTLDSKNPVFREFALALHSKGIAMITFYSGLENNELLLLHKLISYKDLPSGQKLVEFAQSNGLRNIKLVPIDISKFSFTEGVLKDTKGSGQAVWEDYVYGIMEGTLAGEDAAGIVLNVPPEDIARILNGLASGAKEESYDRFIITYLSKKGRPELNRESLNRFMTLVENLSPKIKEQFLARASRHPILKSEEAEETLKELTPEDVERMMNIFEKHTTLPESLRNLIDKLTETAKKTGSSDKIFFEGSSHIDDIEFNEEMRKLFEEDRFGEFVDAQYQRDLESMLKAHEARQYLMSEEVKGALGTAATDSAFAAVILGLADFDSVTREENLQLLTRLSELADTFLETGRFEEVLKIHNTIYSQMIDGKFRGEALSMVEYFFHSEHFISKFLEALKIWGRFNREAALKLAKVLRFYLIKPLFDALDTEESPSQRKFYLSLLSKMGRDVLVEAVRRLDDERWYVVRNMIYLIRECNGAEYVKKLRPLIKHKNIKICLEVLKTLLHLGTPDAVSYLKLFLNEKNLKLKEQSILLSGVYRIREAVPYLIEILEKRDLFVIDLPLKLLVVNALGKIGDPSALDALRRLYNSKHFLYKDVIEKLRSEIIKNLEKYPFEQARPLLELALASGSEEIKALSQKLLSRRSGA